MTQSRPGKILSALDFNKTRTVLFLGLPYTPKRILPIKVWITPYKSSISPVLCRCDICLGCDIHPHHRSRGHAEPLWYHNVMTQPRPDKLLSQPRPGKILSALGLKKAHTVLFLERPYTPKCVLPIKVCITPYKPSISPVLCRCGICLKCYNRCKWYKLISLVKNWQPPNLES